MRLSEWVARVPGLAWKPESVRIRDSVKNAKKLIGGYAYEPGTRSARVMGGIGTLRLPPSESGSRLGTVVRTGDVGAGVPALISSEVWDALAVDGSIEGIVISGKARWVPMSQQWATNFPVLKDIPRGYLVLDDPGKLQSTKQREQTYIAPFSIMEYVSGASELFDYVYAGVRTDEANYRDQVKQFFERYHKDVSPQSRYLIAGDMVEPLWDADFGSPADLRRVDVGARSQLALLERRVREQMLGLDVIEQLLNKLGETVQEEQDLRRLSDEVNIKPNLWLGGGTLAEQISQFVEAAAAQEKLDELIVRLQAEHPEWFLEAGKESPA
jgi:hypothetical protein